MKGHCGQDQPLRLGGCQISSDLILLDIRLPGMDAAMRARPSNRSALKHIPVIASHSYAMASDREKCLAAGLRATSKAINLGRSSRDRALLVYKPKGSDFMNRVLIVDDKPDNLYMLRALLQGHGYVVEEAKHGAEALVKARQLPPAVVISDLLMPGMDGYTLLKHWKAEPQLRCIPFIVYTATYTDPKDERLVLDLGADAFILKPTEPELFIARIRDAGQERAAVVLGHAVQWKKALLMVIATPWCKLEDKVLQVEQANQALVAEIAERQRAESALRSSEERYRTLIAATSAIVWNTPASGEFATDQPGWTAFTGQPFDLLQGWGWLNAVHPDDQRATARVWKAACARRRAFQGEHRIRRRDGEFRQMSVRAVPILEPDRTVKEWVGAHNDVTDQKQAQADLLLRERAVRAATQG